MGLAAGARLGPYEIVAVVGSGGMGEVYRARDTRLAREVAVKVLPAALIDSEPARIRFGQEAQAVAALQHPNICTVYDVGETSDGHPFLVMELLRGETLEQRLARGPLAVADVLDIAVALTDGLGCAHLAGIIHRDIKPANIFLTARGPKILDFGIAKSVARVASAASSTRTASADVLLTAPGSAIGTAAYMSPEQLRGEPLDARSDLFSLGLVLYEMATGRRAFPGATTAVVAAAILHQHPTPPSVTRRDLPPEIDQIVFKALEKDRMLRYSRASEIHTDLLSLRGDSGPAGRTSASRTPVRSRWVMPLAGAVLVLAGAGYLYLQQRATVTERPTLSAGQPIVLADFVNTTGDPVFDGTLRQGLAVQLRQSPTLSLISDDRLRGTLQLMGQPAGARLTPELARQACERTGSGAVLAGSIANLGSEYVLGLSATHCRTGEVLAQEQVQAKRKEDVLHALNEIASAFRTRLGETLSAVPQQNISITEASTASLDAWKAYSTGLAAVLSGSCADAIPLYTHAIDIDPRFAMAHAQLGLCRSILGESVLAAHSTTRAFELRDRVTAPERFFITATYHRQVTGNLEQAQRAFESWAQAYPRDITPHSLSSGFTYQGTGKYERSIQAAKTAISLAADAAPSYANLAFSSIYLERLEDAEAWLRIAQERHVDSFDVMLASYHIAFLRGDQAAMERLAARAAGNRGIEDLIVHLTSLRLAQSGRAQAARKLSRRAVELAEQQGQRERAAVFRAGGAMWEALYGLKSTARRDALDALALSTGRDVTYGSAFALALSGDEARAAALATDLEKRYPEDTSVQWLYLPTLRALAALRQGKPADAVARLEPAEPHDLAIPATAFVGFFGSLYSAYVRGEAYKALRQYDHAALEFRKITDHRGLVLGDPVDTMARLELARVLALANKSDEARSAYQDLLARAKDADLDLAMLAQARAEAAKLR